MTELVEALTGKPEAPRFRLVPAGDLKPRPMNWTISDLIERDSMGQIFGQPGASKTFQGIDMGLCVATGTDYHGKPVRPGPVVYVTGEGQNGLARRLKAWSIVHDIDLTEAPFYVSTMPAALTDMENLLMVMTAIKEIGPVMVIFDTVARNMGPGDENSTQDMTAFVAACDQIRSAHECTILLIHHSGHNATERARGSSVLNGALDVAYRVDKSLDGIVSVTCTKAKDFMPPEPFAFKFRTVELGFDNDDGTEATSAILHPCDMPQAPTKAMGKNQRRALDILEQMFDQRRETLTQSGHDPDGARINLSDWREACQKDMGRSGFYAAKDALIGKGMVSIELGGFVSLEASS